MLRPKTLLVMLVVVVAAAVACTPERLPESEQERICQELLQCWYPGEQGNQFVDAGPTWQGMAHPDNERNVRRTYGPDGSCWHADALAGTPSDGGIVSANALLTSCGVACACTITELCAARSSAAPSPPCAPGAADPCADTAAAAALCGES